MPSIIKQGKQCLTEMLHHRSIYGADMSAAVRSLVIISSVDIYGHQVCFVFVVVV